MGDVAEKSIAGTAAREQHGITCRHSQMPNGEFRFRLLKDDGTAYIRTESASEGAWQNSHFHNEVRETYIVQRGWIGYAELIDDQTRYSIYREGSLFTTQPFVIHNVYLPAGAVIHTVKHGDAKSEQRLEDDRTDRFTRQTHAISEADLLNLGNAESPVGKGASEEQIRRKSVWTYNEAYRHFDGLIWQASVWSSGLFTLALAGTTQINHENAAMIVTDIRYEYVLATFNLLFCGFVLVVSHALYRFRCHQCRAKDYVPNRPLLSPQVGLQAMVNLQAGVLAFIALTLFGIRPLVGGAIVIVGLALMEWHQERQVLGAVDPHSEARKTRS